MGLTRSEQWTLCFVVGLILSGFLLQSYRARRGEDAVWVETSPGWRPITEAPFEPGADTVRGALAGASVSDEGEEPAGTTGARMNLNTASVHELELLPGVGPSKASAIVYYRSDINGFRSIDQLLEVRGIGPKTVERLRPLLTIGEPMSPSDAPAGDREASWSQTEIQTIGIHRLGSHPASPVNINHAGFEELQSIKGIGPVLATRIMEARSRQPFRSVDELLRVKGIGPITLERMRPQVSIE